MESSSNWVLDASLGFNVNLNLPNFEVDVGMKKQEKKRRNLEEELNRINTENKILTKMLTLMCENYCVLQNQIMGLLSPNSKCENEDYNPRKRKDMEVMDLYGVQMSTERGCVSHEDSCKRARFLPTKPNVYKILFQTEKCDTSLVVKDGYQWRKYGQKVTKNNPSPRAYFKCANSPMCPVKKKVQRSVEDEFKLVVTYEGEHNHPQSNSRELNQVLLNSFHSINHSSTSESSNNFINTSSKIPKITLDLTTNHNLCNNVENKSVDTKTLHKMLTQKMASSLTTDPLFASFLAATISRNLP